MKKNTIKDFIALYTDEDEEMFWGHAVAVEGTLKKDPLCADMQR